MEHPDKVDRVNFDKVLARMVQDNNSGTWHQVLETTDDEREICLVVGWEDGYEKGEKFQQDNGDGTVRTLCGKIAVNIDDLQCDYDVDWEMPHWEDGEVYDTSMALVGAEDLPFFEAEARAVALLINRGELEVGERK